MVGKVEEVVVVVRVGNVEKGGVGELGSGAVVVVVRVGKVEKGGVGELGSGAVVVVVRVGNVEEGGVGELGSGAVVVVVRVGKAEQGSASSVSALRIVETCSCDTRLLSTSTAGKGLVAFRGTGESCRCGTSLLSTSARRGSSASDGITEYGCKGAACCGTSI